MKLIFPSVSFRGSDDDLRSKFEEYICSVLATLKYSDYVRNGQNTVMPGGGERYLLITATRRDSDDAFTLHRSRAKLCSTLFREMVGRFQTNLGL